MSRDNYKRIKHMDKATMERYIFAVWMQGYKDGIESVKGKDGATSDENGNNS